MARSNAELLVKFEQVIAAEVESVKSEYAHAPRCQSMSAVLCYKVLSNFKPLHFQPECRNPGSVPLTVRRLMNACTTWSGPSPNLPSSGRQSELSGTRVPRFRLRIE